MNPPPTDNATGPRLVCAHLHLRRGGRDVVQDVNFTLAGDECASLVGPNGSGKTSLLLALLGLLPPTSGTVRLDGVDVGRLAPRARARYAAYVPQSLERVPAFRVAEVVAGGRYAHAGAWRPLAARDHAVIDQALARCGLTSCADQPFDTVSGGERQKTLLAAALAQDAQMLFLDEPDTALDPAVQIELVAILRSWHDTGRGILLISHDLQMPAALGGRVIALRAGRMVADGPAAEVLTPERLALVYDAPFGTATTADGTRVVLPAWWRAASPRL